MTERTGIPAPDQISPIRLIQLLESDGWERTGGREGLYRRLKPPRAGLVATSSLVVPLDDSAPDFLSLMEEAVRSLAASPDVELRLGILRRLTATPADEFRFSKETGAPSGWIDWTGGEDLVRSARGLLASGAKTSRERMRYFGNRHGQFANRFMGEVLMGQTDVGSYVVRAYVPADSAIPIRGGVAASEGAHFEGIDVISTREVSRTIVQTLEATTEALEHFREHNSLSAFVDPGLGISYETVSALQLLAVDAEEAAIQVAWDPSGPRGEGDPVSFTFKASDAPVLERAANRLVEPEPQREVAASGTVHLLSRVESAGPGVIGLTTIDGPTRKLRVRLDEDDYHRALQAHDEGRGVTVVGDLEREGNISWLYHARIVTVTDRNRESEVPPPLRIFDVLEDTIGDDPAF